MERPPSEMTQWIKDLAAAHRMFAGQRVNAGNRLYRIRATLRYNWREGI